MAEKKPAKTAAAKDAKEAKGGMTMAQNAIAFVVAGALAGGVGFFAGMQNKPPEPAREAAKDAVKDAGKPGEKKKEEEVKPAALVDMGSLDIPPVVTNLAAPPETWVRIEGAILFEGKTLPHGDAMAAQISGDLLAFLRTQNSRANSGRLRSGASALRFERESAHALGRPRQAIHHQGPGRAMRRSFALAFPLTILAAMLAATPALAQAAATGDLASALNAAGGMASGQIIQLVALLTVLSLAPGLLMMVTSFTQFVIALSFLRSGLGLQSTPANLVLISLALFMTFFVMAPTFDKSWQDGVKPLIDNKLSEEEAFPKIVDPFRQFMAAQTREKDLRLFEDLSKGAFDISDRTKADLRVLIPAFMISELRRGFEMGFLIILPFLIIDMIVATLTMSMGMMMLPPSMISLPMKLLFFVLIDGWNMLIGSLVRSVN